ncbi:MAG: hypothetical protein LUE13_00025 [Akkermansiaceae bacterium]|nr:hypothetical protein [Akkermansiaceae bacterium]
MIRSIVTLSLLLFGGGEVVADSQSYEEREREYVWLFDMKIKLLNNHEDMLKSSINSYIPYHEEDCLVKEPRWMHNIYLSMQEKHGKKYDVFYAYVSELERCDFLFIKGNIALVCSPYLKIPGSDEKIYSSDELKYLINEVEEELFTEEKPEKVMELVRRLHALKEARCGEEICSRALPPEVAQSLVKIMKTFRGLQPEGTWLNGYELGAIYDYMWDGEPQEFWFYGSGSSLFGASILHRTVPGSPTVYVASIFNHVVRYVRSKPADMKGELDWLKEEMEELPFVRDCH